MEDHVEPVANRFAFHDVAIDHPEVVDEEQVEALARARERTDGGGEIAVVSALEPTRDVDLVTKLEHA